MSLPATGAGEGPLVFLIAGEPSGDRLGARLMAELRACRPGVRFAGVGGPEMAAEGLASQFPMAELSVMGIAEILPHLPRLLRRIAETAEAAAAMRPAVVVTIDSPSFTVRVAKRLKGRGFPLVHYVAPTVWAWKPWRARKFARVFDHLLALLPFEPPYFEAEGLACTFVGHPAVEPGVGTVDGRAFRARHGIADDARVVCLLPGSRRGEVGRLLPVFVETLDRLAQARPGLAAVLPTVDGVAEAVAAGIAASRVPITVVRGEGDKADAFAASDLALAASGTVAVELAAARVPAVIAYRVAPLTGWVLRRVVKVPYANLVNLVLGREAVPELLQDACRADRLSKTLARLLDDAEARAAQTAASGEALEALGLGDARPSRRAAEVVADVMAGRADRPLLSTAGPTSAGPMSSGPGA